MLIFVLGTELASFLKKLFFWNYARNTWQWDVLCVLILVFIFLTPKSWFSNSERWPLAAHQRPTSTLLMGVDVVEKEADKSSLQQRVRTLTGRPEAEVVAVRKVVNQDGRVSGYEVDIR